MPDTASVPNPFAAASLDDRYRASRGPVFVTGMQALTRMLLEQADRDARAGIKTAGYISGYRGSPLGGFDRALWQAQALLRERHIRFQPGVNEELAATAIWGTQQTAVFAGAKFEGVFSLWYGKGPGVDRAGDALRHANYAGTAPKGGVLAVVGDDTSAQSSTITQHSEHMLQGLYMPILYPADLQDVIDFGLYGWAMSRFSGAWVALKLVADTADTTAVVQVDPDRPRILLPEDFSFPPGGVHIRWPDPTVEQEARLFAAKIPAAQAFARVNGLDRIVLDSPRARLGIAAPGKAYLDVRQALADLGIDDARTQALGIRIYKVALLWPIETAGLERFADGLEEILVVEEGKSLLEEQIKAHLYNKPGARPRVVGKTDEKGRPLLPSHGELSPASIARAIARRFGEFGMSEIADDPRIKGRLETLDGKDRAFAPPALARTPHFCSGCPHNSSTKTPEGSVSLAGIGCHVLSLGMGRSETWTQMGGEGMTWCGLAPFHNTAHAFVNIGDGTFFHSGSLALRAAVASGASITYKLLYNDAVAMTGGQPIDGQMSPARMAGSARAEGVERIAVTTDALESLEPNTDYPAGTTFHDRDEIDAVQRELRTHKGVSLLIHVQTCATEKRRRRKRGTLADSDTRVFINDRVCEGCGDCGETSNCLSVLPLETEFGRKREIDQSACNKDYSCLKGFCPSFVSVTGARLKKPAQAKPDPARMAALKVPVLPDTAASYDIVIAGIGGTGVVTMNAVIATAAHLEGRHVAALDITGLAQKFGAVFSHVRIGGPAAPIHASRVASANAALLLGADLVAAASNEALGPACPGRTAAVVNAYEQMTGDFTREPDMRLPTESLTGRIRANGDPNRVSFVDATAFARDLGGDTIGANFFLLGVAWQKGLVPMGPAALERAIELNGVGADANKAIFAWGRLYAEDPDWVERCRRVQHFVPDSRKISLSRDEQIARRVADLTAYQDAAYGARYRALVDRVDATERERTPGMSGLALAVARNYYKLLAYKDEYEVARLYRATDFRAALGDRFEQGYGLRIHLAPPLLDRILGRKVPKKHAFGPWVLGLFGILARLKFLRGTMFDPFGYSTERRGERCEIRRYEELVGELLAGLDRNNHALALTLADLPEKIRGFGHVKQKTLDAVEVERARLLARWRAGQTGQGRLSAAE